MNTIEDLKNIVEKEQEIFIYGAGNVAGSIYHILKCHNLQSAISAYIVKDKSMNPEKVNNIPVYQADECDTDDKKVIIALAYDKQEEIFSYLLKLGFSRNRIIRLEEQFYPLLSQEEKKLFKSEDYWNQRYESGGNSGSGSYNRLAEYKASVLNEFVENEKIDLVLEWGCGDGNQLNLAKYKRYVGYDVSEKAIEICKEKFANDKTKQFICCGNAQFHNEIKGELVLSLDVIYHLVEDDVFEQYMERLFESSNKYVCIYASNFNEQTVMHVKHRKFTDWIEHNVGDRWKLEKMIKNIYPYEKTNPDNTSVSDFYFYRLCCE